MPGDAVVEDGLFPPQQSRCDRLACKSVAKCEAAILFLNDELTPDELTHTGQGGIFVKFGNRLQMRKVEADTKYRCEVQQRACFG